MSSYFCKTCNLTVEAEVDPGEGHSFCPRCGLQLEDVYLQQGPTFVQDGAFSHMAGTIVREEDLGREGGALHGARDRSAQKGKYWIRNFAHQLQIPEANTYIDQAARLYQLAMSTGFTRGRRVNQVAAACLYVVLRQDRRPYLLIDFCKLVSVNVYVLGSTYLRLTETLRLSTHPVQVCLVDPSLYIHRFAGKLQLQQRQMQSVVNTSMHLIATMKRDWMQTGRRPAGVCGAALFLACHIHGVKVSRRDIIKVVSVGESTILHRISELRNTSSSTMMLSEFQEHAKKCHDHQLLLEASTNAVRPAVPHTACCPVFTALLSPRCKRTASHHTVLCRESDEHARSAGRGGCGRGWPLIRSEVPARGEENGDRARIWDVLCMFYILRACIWWHLPRR
jgi:transcription factor IIIB 90 kDa subunit